MPNGCRINTEGSLIFFEEIKHSPRNNFIIHTHVFYKNHLGEHSGLNSSEKLKVNSAWDKWYAISSKGWKEASHNYE